MQSTSFTTGRPALRIDGLSHHYATEPVLQDLTFTLEQGETLALVGPSGCGKTTLMHLMAGLVDVQSGSLRNPFRRVACVFQQPRLLPWKSALDNLALGLKARAISRSERNRKARLLADRMGLTATDLDKYPDQLSGGMQSRISLARALVTEPDLLLLDEPFSALDIGRKQRLYQDLLALRQQQTTIVIITHDLMEAVRLSDRILVLAPRPGRILAEAQVPVPAKQRDESYVHGETARLMQLAEVRTAFSLPNLDPAGDWRSPGDHALTVSQPTPAKVRPTEGVSC